MTSPTLGRFPRRASLLVRRVHPPPAMALKNCIPPELSRLSAIITDHRQRPYAQAPVAERPIVLPPGTQGERHHADRPRTLCHRFRTLFSPSPSRRNGKSRAPIALGHHGPQLSISDRQ